MKGEHIPKATMTAYLREKLGKTKVGTEFVEGILHLSNQYITKISSKANQICTGENKKTISLDHLYQTIEFFKLKHQMEDLKKVETEVKDIAAFKHQVKLKIQQSYQEMQKEGKGLQLRRDNSLIAGTKGQVGSKIFQKKEEESQDYEDELEQEEQINEGKDSKDEKATLKQSSPKNNGDLAE